MAESIPAQPSPLEPTIHLQGRVKRRSPHSSPINVAFNCSESYHLLRGRRVSGLSSLLSALNDATKFTLHCSLTRPLSLWVQSVLRRDPRFLLRSSISLHPATWHLASFYVARYPNVWNTGQIQISLIDAAIPYFKPNTLFLRIPYLD